MRKKRQSHGKHRIKLKDSIFGSSKKTMRTWIQHFSSVRIRIQYSSVWMIKSCITAEKNNFYKKTALPLGFMKNVQATDEAFSPENFHHFVT
jgi:hypothetical protein